MGKPFEIKNATIDETMLGMEDHGIFTCVLYLKYSKTSSQGFGTHDLRGKWGTAYLQRLLETVGVEKWEDLPGKHIRVKLGDGEGFWGNTIEAIGNIVEDEWFCPKEFGKKYFPNDD